MSEVGTVITSIRIEQSVLEEIQESGVKNVSKYFENLAKRDLRGVKKVGKRESQRVQKMLGDLDLLRNKWDELMKAKGDW